MNNYQDINTIKKNNPYDDLLQRQGNDVVLPLSGKGAGSSLSRITSSNIHSGGVSKQFIPEGFGNSKFDGEWDMSDMYNEMSLQDRRAANQSQ